MPLREGLRKWHLASRAFWPPVSSQTHSLCIFLSVTFLDVYINHKCVFLKMWHASVTFYVCVCVLSSFSRVWLSVTPWTVARQAPLSMGFSRQEHWSGLPCPPPGYLPDPGIKSTSPALAGRFFTTSTTWEVLLCMCVCVCVCVFVYMGIQKSVASHWSNLAHAHTKIHIFCWVERNI